MVLAKKRVVGDEFDYLEYQEQQQTNDKQKKKIAKEASPAVIIVVGLFFVGLIMATGLSYTFLKAAKAQSNWQIGELKNNIITTQMENDRLRFEIAKLKSLDNIENIARTQLGMVKPKEVEYYIMDLQANSEVNAKKSTNIQNVSEGSISDDSKNKILEKIASVFDKE